MKVAGLAMPVGNHFDDVLDDHRRVTGPHEAHQRRLDLALTRPTHLVVVVFDRHPHRPEVQAHLGAQVVECVLGRNGVIPTVKRDVVTVPPCAAAPGSLARFDAVASTVHLILVGHTVKDVKLELWPPLAPVGDAALDQVLLGTAGNIARVVEKDRLRVSLQRRADETEGRCVPKGIGKASREIRHQHHVTGLD